MESETEYYGPYHVGRAWVGHAIEDACRCPQVSCGLVDLDDVADWCSEHNPLDHRQATTFRQVHAAIDCPGITIRTEEA